MELFFKWIKQNLRIKAFFGTSENAVKTQFWDCRQRLPADHHHAKHLDITQSLAEWYRY